jgi:hypothetical protein
MADKMKRINRTAESLQTKHRKEEKTLSYVLDFTFRLIEIELLLIATLIYDKG